MANSIYGKADSTLVNMAYAAAMANVPLDQTAVFAAREENLRNFTQLVSQLTQPEWDGYEAAKKRLNTSAQRTRDIQLLGGNTNPMDLAQHQDWVWGYKNELETIKNDPNLTAQQKELAETDLSARMSKYQGAITKESEFLPKIIGNMADGNVYFDPGSEEAMVAEVMLEGYNTNTTMFLRDRNDQQEITYTTPGGITKTTTDLEKGLTIRDSKYQTKIQRTLNGFLKETIDLQEKGTPVTPAHKERMVRILMDEMIDIHHVRNLSHGMYNDNNHNFLEVFAGQAKTSGLNDHEMINTSGIEIIYNVLDRMGGIDFDKSGTITQEEKDFYRTPENAVEVRKHILADKDLYEQILAGYLVDNTLKDVDPISMMENLSAVENEAKKAAAAKKKKEEEERKRKEFPMVVRPEENNEEIEETAEDIYNQAMGKQ